MLSPLYWSLRDGNFPMVQFIIEDLLQIREAQPMPDALADLPITCTSLAAFVLGS
jgi:hypothetical protein